MSIHNIIRIIKEFYEGGLNLLFPPFCLLCDIRLENGNDLICSNCYQNLPKIDKKLPPFPPLEKIYSPLSYSEKTSQIIHHFKYNNKSSIGKQLGKIIAEYLSNFPIIKEIDLIIPIALHSRRERERGFNQSNLLAEVIAEYLHIPLSTKSLKRIRYTTSQTNLNPEQRRHNVAKAFQIVKPELIKNKSILLIDDVYTTGATMSACAEELYKVGAKMVSGATVSRA